MFNINLIRPKANPQASLCPESSLSLAPSPHSQGIGWWCVDPRLFRAQVQSPLCFERCRILRMSVSKPQSCFLDMTCCLLPK